MDEEKRPADILDEIWNRSKERPAPTPCPPKFAPPPEAPSREAALLPWLCLLLAVVAAALTACLFQLSGVRARLASLEEAVGDGYGSAAGGKPVPRQREEPVGRLGRSKV